MEKQNMIMDYAIQKVWTRQNKLKEYPKDFSSSRTFEIDGTYFTHAWLRTGRPSKQVLTIAGQRYSSTIESDFLVHLPHPHVFLVFMEPRQNWIINEPQLVPAFHLCLKFEVQAYFLVVEPMEVSFKLNNNLPSMNDSL